MKLIKRLLTVLMFTVGYVGASQAIAVTSEAPTGYFVPDASLTYSSPYYRGYGQNWDWTHSAIAGAFTSASLSISAFDVDFSDGEIDNIYAMNSGTWVLLGALSGATDVYAFTTFLLGSEFYDDIATGLKVMLAIDANASGWYVSLAKSVLTLDNAELPPADPGSNNIPEPGSLALLGLGLAAMVVARKRKV